MTNSDEGGRKDQMRPLVSVIIPVYNVDQYLTQCMESVVNQTYDNLEIILVDDGSTDQSSKICDQFSNQDHRIKIFHRTNSGVSAARNYGLNLAIGEYISFVDSDDWIEPDMIESLVTAALSSCSDLSICGYNEYNEDHFVKKVCFQPGIYSRDQVVFMNVTNKLAIAPWGRLYKHITIRDIRFQTNIIYEDILYSAMTLNKISQCIILDDSKYNYRFQRTGSTSNLGFNPRKITDELPSYFTRMEYLISSSNYEIAKMDFDRFIRRLRNYSVSLSKSNIENKKDYYKYIQEYSKRALKCGIKMNFKQWLKLYTLYLSPTVLNAVIEYKR